MIIVYTYCYYRYYPYDIQQRGYLAAGVSADFAVLEQMSSEELLSQAQPQLLLTQLLVTQQLVTQYVSPPVLRCSDCQSQKCPDLPPTWVSAAHLFAPWLMHSLRFFLPAQPELIS